MKLSLFGIIIGLIQLTGFSQSDVESIKLSDDINLIKISDNAYIHVSYVNSPDYGRIGANGLIYIDNNEVFLFDTPWTYEQTEKLYSWITDSKNLKVIGFMPNHWHVDCMGGLGFLLEQNIESYANQMTIDIARSKGLPVPEHGFKDSLELKVGGKTVKCFFLGGAHSLDNIVVWIPAEEILFPGCIVKSMETRNLGNTADGDLISYPETLTSLLQLFPSARIVIPGHGNYGGTELIKHTLELATY